MKEVIIHYHCRKGIEIVFFQNQDTFDIYYRSLELALKHLGLKKKTI